MLILKLNKYKKKVKQKFEKKMCKIWIIFYNYVKLN